MIRWPFRQAVRPQAPPSQLISTAPRQRLTAEFRIPPRSPMRRRSLRSRLHRIVLEIPISTCVNFKDRFVLFKQEIGMQKQSGFTLIELVVVIVILGILSAVALPKFIDLSSQANLAAAQGVAGALSSATSINYAAKKASAAGGVTVTTCTSALATLTGGALPTNFALNN